MGATGIPQRNLSRLRCEWGREARVHAVAHPVFGRDYRVRGILAFTPGAGLLWYGEVPAHVEQGLIRFKAAFQEGGPPALADMDAREFEGALLCDPWGMASDLLGLFASSTGHAVPGNVHGQILRGRPLVDIEFERTLHCVRSVILSRGLLRQETLPVLGIPAWADSLAPAPRQGPGSFRWPWTARR